MHRLAAVLIVAPLLFEVTIAQVGGDQLIAAIEGGGVTLAHLLLRTPRNDRF